MRSELLVGSLGGSYGLLLADDASCGKELHVDPGICVVVLLLPLRFRLFFLQ